jgi:hypothetical protein
MRRIFGQLLAVAVGVFAVSQPSIGSDPFTMPTVTATGRFDDGGFLICRGLACAGVTAGYIDRSPYETELTLQVEDGIDREQFCERLKSKRPSNCNASSPPSTPGLDSSWQPNGCGTGGMSNLLLDSGMEVLLSDNYSGDFHAPYEGVSFRSSCDAHDACWGVAGNRSTCDNAFHNSMTSACGAVAQASSRTVCNGFAAAYFSAVSITNIGNSNYQRAAQNRQCALWAYDMKANGCG